MKENPRIPSKEFDIGSDLTIYLAGMTGTVAGQEHLKRHLEEAQLGEGIRAYGSVVSTDALDSDRNSAITQEICEALLKDQRVRIIAHSLGATELSRILRILRERIAKEIKTSKIDQMNDLLEKNVEIALISPFGLASNKKEAMQMIFRSLSIASPLNLGINSFILFQPAFLADSTDTHRLLSRVFSKILSKDAAENENFFEYTTQGRGFIDLLDARLQAQLKTAVQEVDSIFLAELNRMLQAQDSNDVKSVNKSVQKLKKLLIRRGSVLKPYVNQAFMNEKGGEFAQIDIVELVKNCLSLCLTKEGRKTVFGSLNGEVYRTFLYLKAQGVNIKLIIPQFDVLLPLESAEHIFEDSSAKAANLDSDQDDIFVLGNSTHEGFAIRAQALANTLKRVFSRS